MNYAFSGVDNEFYFAHRQRWFTYPTVKGTSVTSSAVNFNTLVGAGPQTLSVTWNNAAGTYEFFLNGTTFASGSGLQTGATLTSSVVLVLGHDQDVMVEVSQSSQASREPFMMCDSLATYAHQLRLHRDFRSDLPRNEGNHIANWRFNDLSTAGVTTDAVSGNNLTVRHATLPGFTATPLYSRW